MILQSIEKFLQKSWANFVQISKINSRQCQRARHQVLPPLPCLSRRIDLGILGTWPSAVSWDVEPRQAAGGGTAGLWFFLFGLKHFYFECLSLKYTPAIYICVCVSVYICSIQTHCDKYTHTDMTAAGCPLDGILHNYSSSQAASTEAALSTL